MQIHLAIYAAIGGVFALQALHINARWAERNPIKVAIAAIFFWPVSLTFQVLRFLEKHLYFGGL